MTATILGGVCGILCSAKAGSFLLPLMRGAANCSVSIVDLLYTSALPFLFLLLAVMLSAHGWMIPICFIKAFSFGFSLGAVYAAFGTAGWLIASILLCSHAVSSLLVIWFSLRHISGFRAYAGSDWMLCLVIAAIASIIENCWIAPFLALVIIQ